VRPEEREIQLALATKYGVHTDTVENVLYHAFEFCRKVIQDSNDLRPIYYQGLGTFLLKAPYRAPGKK
jgi:hypothetical protein